MRFVKNPVEFDAVQWTGENLEEIQQFCGTRTVDSVDADKFEIQVFSLIGERLVADVHPGTTGELWVEANKQTLALETGEWVIKDERGFYPCKDEIMKKNNTPITDRWETPVNFEQELVWLLNKHSVENRSNTPDWILAEYIRMSLQAWDLGTRLRDDWYGISPAPGVPGALKPSTQEIDTNDIAVRTEPEVYAPGVLESSHGKIVPLVQYVDGKRNVIGEAQIQVTPGEVMFTGTLGNVESVVPILGTHVAEGQFSLADTDPLKKGDH